MNSSKTSTKNLHRVPRIASLFVNSAASRIWSKAGDTLERQPVNGELQPGCCGGARKATAPFLAPLTSVTQKRVTFSRPQHHSPSAWPECCERWRLRHGIGLKFGWQKTPSSAIILTATRVQYSKPANPLETHWGLTTDTRKTKQWVRYLNQNNQFSLPAVY